MQYQDIYWRLAGVTQHAEFEQFLKDCLFDKQRREKFYMELASEIGGGQLGLKIPLSLTLKSMLLRERVTSRITHRHPLQQSLLN